MSILFWAVSVGFSGAGVRLRPAGAFPPCRLPTLPFALILPPSPSPPSQREGGDQGYFMQGASPLASPASDCLRHLQSLPYKCTCGRALSFSSANPALSFDSAPIPPTPFPGGEGGDQGYFMQGASPLASPGIDRARHWLCLRETGSSGVAGGTPALPLSTPPPVNP